MLQFEVTVEEANILVGALSELPAKVSMGLIQKLQGQAAPQLAELNASAADEAKELAEAANEE